ncbi:MAG: putative acyl-CoA dehydrogenase [Candidatus Binatia bacterium]|nr:MAG: putative acyl-CoA dehydrogenase [Candidatus Binatia bacterium]
MDFSFTEEQKGLANLAEQIFRDRSSLERLKAVEQSEDGYDLELWAELAKAGLLGAALPESLGGSGGGFLEACLLLEQQGKHVVLVPLLPTIISAMTLARFATPDLQNRFLPPVCTGEAVLSPAFSELGTDERTPTTMATADSRGWRLNGVKTAVPFAHRAAALLVPARTTGGNVLMFLVPSDARGIRMEKQQTTNWEPHFRVTLDNVATASGNLIGTAENGAQVLGWAVDRYTVGLCAIAAGACERALKITAEYASNRKQFDKPIAMFQAVGQRMADSYIDNEAVQLTMWQAASRLAEEIPSDKEVATAKYWAAEGGSRIGHASLHIHGGISIDVDYPIHRYFLWLKQIEFTLGAATPQLVRLGSLLAGHDELLDLGTAARG